MWPWIPKAIEAAGNIFGSLMGRKGQQDTNAANAQQAQAQMDFQERMSNTAHQREVKDLIAAGLNPALAYHNNGASAPPGASATMGNVEQAGAQYGATVASMVQAAAQARNIDADTRQRNIESAARLQELEARVANTKQATAEGVARTTGTELGNRFQDETFAMRMDQMRRDITRTSATARDLSASAALKEAQLPREAIKGRGYGLLDKAADVTEEWTNKYVVPLVNNARERYREQTHSKSRGGSSRQF